LRILIDDTDDDTDYIKQDLLSEAESQYFAAKSKINELLNKELVTESASNKICCHNEAPRSELPKIMIPEFDGNKQVGGFSGHVRLSDS